ncbi:hypothetical protein OTB20_25370 [Streptomyces sp. H27-H1]|uniref:hypothetical protein n=1 Tax=unclassified Streptomyces TaxID=2593676 RepID=UPI00226F270A|nr:MULTISPECIES: hypothetical protein [unclassified Streptomyces]MCY0929470.1 hypothetical protein [Streptomyces sp. H27-H1]MCY0938314.1 hypothetical protein [Streptomyces sp. H34-S4]
MSAAVHALGVLTATVHVVDPMQRVPLVLTAGTEVTDPEIAEQITNPNCWENDEPPKAKPARKGTPSA